MLPLDLKDNPKKYHCVHYDSILPPIKLVSTLKFNVKDNHGVAVFTGMMEKKKMVIKWHIGRKHPPSPPSNTVDEENFYSWLHNTGCETAEVYLGYHLVLPNGKLERVLVMECLNPLNEGEDNPVRIGLDLLDQLQYVHRKCVHSGIKPDNILRVSDDDRKYKYLLIDFGSISNLPFEDGYLRHSWPVGWSAQPRKESGQTTYPYIDFIELGITLKHLSRDKKEKKLFKKFIKKASEGTSRRKLVRWLIKHSE